MRKRRAELFPKNTTTLSQTKQLLLIIVLFSLAGIICCRQNKVWISERSSKQKKEQLILCIKIQAHCRNAAKYNARDRDSSGPLWSLALLKTETVKSKIVTRKQAGVQLLKTTQLSGVCHTGTSGTTVESKMLSDLSVNLCWHKCRKTLNKCKQHCKPSTVHQGKSMTRRGQPPQVTLPSVEQHTCSWITLKEWIPFKDMQNLSKCSYLLYKVW